MLDNLETGDLLLFSSNNGCMDKCLKYCTKDKITHIGMILKKPIYINPNLTDIYLIHSSLEDFPDEEDGKIKLGVQISKIDYILKEYANPKNGSLYLRRLYCNRDIKFYEKIVNCHREVHNKPYDLDIVDWIKAKLELDGDIKFKDNEKKNRFWCSALVGYFYHNLGFIDLNLGWSYLAPNQFSSEDKKQLTFYNCNLSNDEKINI